MPNQPRMVRSHLAIGKVEETPNGLLEHYKELSSMCWTFHANQMTGMLHVQRAKDRRSLTHPVAGTGEFSGQRSRVCEEFRYLRPGQSALLE